MKKYLIALGLIALFLVVFIPFASNEPDGLEKVAENLGVEEHEPAWKGLMHDYSTGLVEDPFLSTLLAGIFGTVLVLVVTIVLVKATTKKSSASKTVLKES
jgi:hypothetical protein